MGRPGPAQRGRAELPVPRLRGLPLHVGPGPAPQWRHHRRQLDRPHSAAHIASAQQEGLDHARDAGVIAGIFAGIAAMMAIVLRRLVVLSDSSRRRRAATRTEQSMAAFAHASTAPQTVLRPRLVRRRPDRRGGRQADRGASRVAWTRSRSAHRAISRSTSSSSLTGLDADRCDHGPLLGGLIGNHLVADDAGEPISEQ